MSRARPRPSPYAMADSAASPSSRSKRSSPAKTRSRAASSGDDRRPARAAVEPELLVAQEAGLKLADAELTPHFDPRQGTLLGFELPADALAALTSERADMSIERPLPISAEGDAPSERHSPGASGQALAEAAPAAPEQPEVPLDDAGPDQTEMAASRDTPAIVRKAARAKNGRGHARVSDDGVSGAAASTERALAANISAASLLHAPSPSSDAGEASTAEPAEAASLARSVASLREALQQERDAAQQRWRRTRNWLAVASAGVALVLAASAAQTVALVRFAQRAEAAQQQAQSALNGQQAALANLASATSALSARMQTPAAQAPAADASAASNPEQPRSKHPKTAHARRSKEKEKTK